MKSSSLRLVLWMALTLLATSPAGPPMSGTTCRRATPPPSDP